MEEAIEIEISENHQPKAGVFLSMMHSPKRQAIKISILYVCVCVCAHVHVCVCTCICPHIYECVHINIHIVLYIYTNIVFKRKICGN